MPEPRRPVAEESDWRNDEVNWDNWPVTQYVLENYRDLHPLDVSIIEHHSAFYRAIPPDSIDRSVEIGAGPNLYPMMLAAAASRRIDALEYSAANVAYLRRQLGELTDDSWQPFYRRCRELNPALPGTLADALSRVRVVHGNALAITPDTYGLASMHFVAEGATESVREFVAFCRAFVGSVRPGGHLVAGFMENLARYELGDGSAWPGYAVDADIIRAVFSPLVTDLRLTHVDPDPTLPDWGYSGVLLMAGRRPGPGALRAAGG